MSIIALKLAVPQPPKINCNYQYQDAELQWILSSRLLQVLQTFLEKLSQPVYVLTSIDFNTNDCLIAKLQQEKLKHNNQRIVIIPINLGNLHWAGILIDFNQNSVNRAEYFDPLNQCSTVAVNLQLQFANVYPNNILQFKNLLKSPDLLNCGVYLIENFILSIQNLNHQQQPKVTTKKLRQLQLNSLKYYNFEYYCKFLQQQSLN